METLLVLVAFAVVSSLGLLMASHRRQSRLRAWRLAANLAGLADVRLEEGRGLGGGALLGRSGDLQVRLEADSSGDKESGTKIVVGGLGDGAGGLSLRREGLSTALERRVVGDREIQIGDPPFDEEYYVQGWPPLVLALLDADTRATLAALMRNRVAMSHGEPVKAGTSLIGGVLVVRVQDGALLTNLRRLPEVVAAVVEVARRLVAPDDLAARIAGNLRTEPVAGVRLQCLATLAREFPGHPATREALLAARGDSDAEVRLRAGIALGSEGRDVLRSLATGEGATDQTTECAVAALEPDLAVEEAIGLLRGALRSGQLQAQRPELERVLGLVVPAPDQGPDAGQELLERERLHEVVVGARVEQVDLVVDVAERAHHDDRDLGPKRPHSLEHVEPVPVGEDEVEEDEVVLVRHAHAERLGSRRRALHRVPLGREALHHERRDAVLVFDHEYAHGSPCLVLLS